MIMKQDNLHLEQKEMFTLNIHYFYISIKLKITFLILNKSDGLPNNFLVCNVICFIRIIDFSYVDLESICEQNF